MTEQLLTRCPNCATLFKLYPRQIEAAGGFVRCGSCMKVFKAHKHIVDPIELPTVETLNPPTAVNTHSAPQPGSIANTASPAAASTSPPQANWGEELTDDMDKIYQHLAAELADYQAIDPARFIEKQAATSAASAPKPSVQNPYLNPAQPTPGPAATKTTQQEDRKPRLPKFEDDLSDSFKSLPLSKAELQRSTNSVEIEEADESWAEQMLKELDEFNEAIPETVIYKPEADHQDSGGILNPALAANLIQELSPTEQHTLEQHTPESQQTAASTPLKVSLPPWKSSTPKKPSLTVEEEKTAGLSAGVKFTSSQSTKSKSVRLSNSLQLLPLDTGSLAGQPQRLGNIPVLVADDDQVINFRRSRRPITLPINYTLGCLILAVVLVIEVGVFKFAQFNQIETLRPAYVLACQALGCRLPPRQDISKINSLKLDVREHPTASHVLQANILINNTASFAQPFPDLTLRFMDSNQEVIAQRRFTPQEYQHKELNSLRFMPSNQPVRLVLDIIDPGQAAVNYDLDICASNSSTPNCKS